MPDLEACVVDNEQGFSSLSKMTIDVDRLLRLNTFGRETSEDDLILFLEHEKTREQSGEHQLRQIALWMDSDKDARLERFKHLLQHVKLDTISYERYAEITTGNMPLSIVSRAGRYCGVYRHIVLDGSFLGRTSLPCKTNG